MSCRTWWICCTLAVALSLGAAVPARASLIIPSDFTVQRSWTLTSCQRFPGESPPLTACIDAIVAFGVSSTTNQYGFTYDAPSFHFQNGIFGEACVFGFSSASTSTTFVYGAVFQSSPYFCYGPLSYDPQPSTVYSPQLRADSQLILAEAYYQQNIFTCGLCGGLTIDMTVSAIAAPEPDTMLLLATGLLTLAAIRWRSPRKKAGHEVVAVT
jgi:hypothetical protein